MSGETAVEFLPTPSGRTERLVEAAAFLSSRAGDRVALIGGLAVACRLGSVHRVTQDVDAVAEAGPGEPDVIEILVADAAVERTDRAHRVMVGDVKVEIIETVDLPDDLDDISHDQRLFVLAHRWGLTTATTMTVRVAGESLEASLPVASGASLVAMKLHAAIDRADDAKRASDLYDIYRLLERDERLLQARSFASAPHDLAGLVAAGVSRLFDDAAERSARWLLVHGGADAQHIKAEELRRVCAPFLAALDAFPS